MQQRTYQAIFFDLDGTLLNLDMDYFLQRYFTGIAAFAARHGYEPNRFTEALQAGVASMIDAVGKTNASTPTTASEPNTSEPNTSVANAKAAASANDTASAPLIPTTASTNADRFWATFEHLLGKTRTEAEPLLLEYYRTDFNDIGADIKPRAEALEILEILKSKHYPLLLTTMPLFPLVAIEQRLAWAGLDAHFFDRITTYDNSHSTKPHVSYYQENVDASHVSPKHILMVGNNTREDLAAMELGLDAYLVTDCLLNPNDFDIDQVKHGSLSDFLQFVKTLDDCE